MIFRCSDQGCGYFGEGPPAAGVLSPLRQADAPGGGGEMTGDDWSAPWCLLDQPARWERGTGLLPPLRRNGKRLGDLQPGHLYGTGVGVEADPARLSGFISRPWRWGACRRCAIWASAMSRGSAPLQTRKKAVELFRQAAEHGSSRGQRLLARCLEQGLGLPQDQKAALEWLRTSALQGDASSQAELARHYEFGIGTEISPSRPYSGTAVRLRQGCGRTVLSGLADGTRKMGGAGRGRRGPALFAGGGAGAQPGRSASGDLLPQWDRDAPGPRPGLGPAGPGMGSWGPSPRPASWDRCA